MLKKHLALVCALSALSAVPASALPTPADTDALPVFDENYITLGAQGAWLKGNKAAFQAENYTSKKGFGGIQDFQLSRDFKGDLSLKADGHFLAGSEDYLAHLQLSKNEFGKVDVGYKRFRTYYDGIGGFFPQNNAWFPLPNRELHVDRSKFWTEITLATPNSPEITLRYTNELRNGAKDTTIWGDTDFTGIPISSSSTLNPISSNRKIVANYLQMDERHQVLEALAKKTFGETTVQLSVTGDRVDNLDTRSINRYPGEVKPFRVIRATPVSTVPPAWANNAIYGFDRQGVKTDSLTFAGKVETVLSEKAKLFAGASYQHANTDFTGYRPLTTDIATTPLGTLSVLGGFNAASAASAPYPSVAAGRAPGSYRDLSGGAKSEVLAANVGADLTLGQDLFVEVGLKGENRYVGANDSFYYLSRSVNQITGTITDSSTTYRGKSRIKERAWTPEISLRYTGIRTVALYASGDYRYSPGKEDVTYVTTSSSVSNDDVRENHGNYTVGANWTPNGYASVRAETFYKDHRNSFNGYAASAGGEYVLGYSYYGGKFTVVLRPLPTVTATTRYILQTGWMDVATDTARTYESADVRSHQIGETIDWAPMKQFYMQASANLTYSQTSTAYPRAGGTANLVLRNSDNNYWNASLLAGFVVDKLTNAEIQATYYKADNFQPDIWTTQPYGAGARQYSVTAGVKRKLTDKLIAEAKIGYVSSRNDTTGGLTNYSARLAYLTLQQAF